MREKGCLHWWVLRASFNNRKVEKYDVLAYREEEIRKARKKCKTRAELKEWLRKEFMYYYWSKSECELIVGRFI